MLLAPLTKEKINISAITSSHDSILLIFEYTDEKAYKILNIHSVKIGIFKHAKEHVKAIIKKIIRNSFLILCFFNFHKFYNVLKCGCICNYLKGTSIRKCITAWIFR